MILVEGYSPPPLTGKVRTFIWNAQWKKRVAGWTELMYQINLNNYLKAQKLLSLNYYTFFSIFGFPKYRFSDKIFISLWCSCNNSQSNVCIQCILLCTISIHLTLYHILDYPEDHLHIHLTLYHLPDYP